MTPDWAVVTLVADDYSAVRALWEAAGLPIKPAGRDNEEQFACQLAGGTQTALGIRDGKRLVGVVLATHDGRKGWLNRLAVDPQYRRRGIAQCLIAAAERVLYSQGMQIIAALIEGENTASLALFEQAGYQDYPGIHYVTKRRDNSV